MTKMLAGFFRFAMIAFLFLSSEQTSDAKDRHEGYYYPAVNSSEIYESQLPLLPTVSKRSRIGLIVGLNEKQLNRNFAPGYHLYAKGENAQKLILVATEVQRYQSLFQLRALLAAMTSMARTSPLFTKSGTPENLNFLDLCKMAGFTQVTLTNGIDLTHQIFVE